MPQDLSKPSVLIFLKEMYEKENRLRVQWVQRHRQKLNLAATLQRVPTDYYEEDVIRQNMSGGLAAITRDHVIAGYNRRKVPLRDAASMLDASNLREDHTIVKVGLGDANEDPRLVRPKTDLSLDPVMRPVDPKLKKVIYIPKAPFGRQMYLKKRTKESPENRYYFPECSNWDYGWRMGDSKMKHPTRYGRCMQIKRTVHTRVGPQPDPHHYKSSEEYNYQKCGDL